MVEEPRDGSCEILSDFEILRLTVDQEQQISFFPIPTEKKSNQRFCSGCITSSSSQKGFQQTDRLENF